jgi:DNA-binding LytR/AlgR family response regulator
MRLGDAIAGLGGHAGIQVHRCWWVAAHAVETVSRAGDGLQLKLHNGLTIPVSRSYARQARKMWADRLA